MEISVVFASRYKRRKAANAVGKNLLKTLTEPITNSDDSYRRLVDEGLVDPNEVQTIIIEIDKAKRSFRIIDRAEGLTDEKMVKYFGTYGEDTSGGSQGSGVRGLFGQGISDVLFHHSNGMVQSIVDRTLYICKFRQSPDGDWKIDPQRTKVHVDERLRKSLGIPQGNGTVISFTLAEGTTIPYKLEQKLRDFYMLRLINNDSSRRILLVEKSKAGNRQYQIKYEFPEGEQIGGSWNEVLQFEKYEPVRVKIDLFQSRESLAEQQNGLLVFDEKKAVYDLSLFGYPLDFPGAERLYGSVELTGARAIIYDKINQKEPEEILTDERNGFNTSHDFYKQLEAIVKPKLDELLLVKASTQKQEPEKTDPRQQKVFEMFDELYREIIGSDTLIASPKVDLTPPEGGLQFDRKNVNTTVGKTYGIGLNINLSMIPVGSVINVECDKSDIEVEPKVFEVTENLVKGSKLARKILTIQGKKVGESASISAKFKDYETSIIATVVEEDRIYPESIQFYPQEINVAPNGQRKAYLYINTNQLQPGSTIFLSCDDESLKLEHDNVVVKSECDYDEVVKHEIIFSTTEKTTATLTALAIDIGEQATLTVNVVDPHEHKPTKPTTKFKDWMFVPNLGMYQSFYSSTPADPNYGMLLVNSTHPLNKRYFGENPTKASISSSLVAQVYLAEVLTNEILNFIFTEKQQVEQRSGGDPSAVRDPHGYIRNEIARMKQSIGLKAQEMWVDQKRLNEEFKS